MTKTKNEGMENRAEGMAPPCGGWDGDHVAENVCDEFFSLPLFPPASLCNNNEVSVNNAACNQGSCGCGCGCCR